MSDMQIINFREFLREPKKYFPIPKEGIKVVRRDGDDFLIMPIEWTPGEKLPEKVEEIAERTVETPTCQVMLLDTTPGPKKDCPNPATHKYEFSPDDQMFEGIKSVLVCEKHFKELGAN